MYTKIENQRILEIIHNIAEDFRFSSEYEKYAQLFYAMDSTHTLDKKMHLDALEYVKTSKQELKASIAWQEKFQQENPQIEKEQMITTMKVIEKEYDELETYLTMLNV